MKKFKVGDRVMTVKPQPSLFHNMAGEVVCVYLTDYLVRFDQMEGHLLGGRYYFRSGELQMETGPW